MSCGRGLCLLSVGAQGTAILDEEDNMVKVEGETVVVGDLHGQFFDLLNLLNTYGKVSIYVLRIGCV